MAVVKDLAAGKPVPRRVITQESVFTRENAAAELPNRAYSSWPSRLVGDEVPLV